MNVTTEQPRTLIREAIASGGKDELAAHVLLGVTEIWNIMDRDLAADVHDCR